MLSSWHYGNLLARLLLDAGRGFFGLTSQTHLAFDEVGSQKGKSPPPPHLEVPKQEDIRDEV